MLYYLFQWLDRTSLALLLNLQEFQNMYYNVGLIMEMLLLKSILELKKVTLTSAYIQ